MSKTKIAINGFGRIGRNAFKIAFEYDDLEIVAINDLTENELLAHLLKYDSNYGIYGKEVSFDDEHIIVNGRKTRALAEPDPAKLPWKDLGVDIVIESTGRFTKPAEADKHRTGGAKKVVISAPAKGDEAQTFVLGVNQDKLADSTDVVSNASCTTNCITPVAAIMEEHFGIEKAMMTTIHSYTASQALQDGPAGDKRKSRAAAENIVPTTTGATAAAAKALPSLAGIFHGLSLRVPTPVVSLSDFTFVLKRDTTTEEVNRIIEETQQKPGFKGILRATWEELVSRDLIGDTHSAIVDLNLTQVVGGNLVKIVAWYDNEWGYCNRLVELTSSMGKLLK